MSAIVNATPLIALALVRRLDLLPQIFEEVIVPTIVYQEVTGRGDRPGTQAITQANWLQIVSPQTVPSIEPLLLGLDAGEMDVLLLAREWHDALLKQWGYP